MTFRSKRVTASTTGHLGGVRMATSGCRNLGSSEDFVVTCPYCGEDVDVHLERDVQGSLVQDCEVCCNPWLLRVEVEGEDEERTVTATRADGSD
jgi:hypothetical protein